jgi:D-glycero-D-manno-heptose 1,7-bisphosphate phosphatase
VFLDRDGTLHEELAQTLVEPSAMRFFPGVFEAAARLRRAGFELVVITNQSAIARGELDHERLARVHAHLRERFARAGAPLSGIFVCPHHPTEGRAPYKRACACRKPSSGLFTDAADALALDLPRSWIIGDAQRDLEAGARVGVRPVLVATGKGARERAQLGAELASRALFAPDFASAVDQILRAQGR